MGEEIIRVHEYMLQTGGISRVQGGNKTSPDRAGGAGRVRGSDSAHHQGETPKLQSRPHYRLSLVFTELRFPGVKIFLDPPAQNLPCEVGTASMFFVEASN